jgi:hypothetical protein
MQDLNIRFKKALFPSMKFLLAAALAAGSIAADASARLRSRRESEKSKEVYVQPKGPLFAVVSLGKQHVSIYSSNGLVARSPVSTGRPGHPTPTGIFNILQKERYHESNIYSSAPMPFMQRVTWSGVAMHQGVLPGYPASHGCIRMPGEFAKRLFGMTKGNERVVITRQDIVPVNFSHPRLPVPKLMPLPASNIASGSAQVLQNAIAESGVASSLGGAEKVDVALKTETGGSKSEGAEPKFVNPVEFAKIMKARAAANAADAAAAVKPAQNAAAAKSKEVNAANIELRKAEASLARAKERVEDLEREIKRARSEKAVNEATAAKPAAEQALKEAEGRAEAARQAKTEKEAEAANAVKAFKEAEISRKTAADAVKIWNRRLEPISVFISRKTNRLYIRQGYIKVFDVPVTIRDPQKPLGTHLYMAMPQDQPGQDGAALRWLVLSIPDASAADDQDESRSRRRKKRRDDDDAPRAVPSSSASAALDRIELPPEVGDKISEMLWAGGSLIVSDNGISGETGEATDFIILTK